LVLHGRRGAREIENAINVDIERSGDVPVEYVKIVMGHKMRNVVGRTGGKVVERDYRMTRFQQALTQVGTQKAASSRY
jgi:hypothetical protein